MRAILCNNVFAQAVGKQEGESPRLDLDIPATKLALRQASDRGEIDEEELIEQLELLKQWEEIQNQARKFQMSNDSKTK